MTAKEDYIKYCNCGTYIPLFHQPRWLNVVTKKWYVQKIVHKDIVAFMPYTVEKKFGFHFVRNPHLSPYNGPLLTTDCSDIEKEAILLKAQDFLSTFSFAELDCNPLFFRQIENIRSKKTNLLKLDKGINEIEKNLKSSLRRQLHKASRHLRIVPSSNINTLYELYTESIMAQSGAHLIPKRYLEKVYKLCQESQLGEIYIAIDENENAHAAILYVADKKCGYYLLGGSSKTHLGSGAMGYLLWHCIQQANTNGKQYFDFEGSELPGVARFFSTFGGQEVRFPILVSKPNWFLNLLLKLK